MHVLNALIILSLTSSPMALAQSNLLESVKRNPQEAVNLCNRLRSFNSKGISSTSTVVINEISQSKNLTLKDAEIFSIYVIGMHCPDVK